MRRFPSDPFIADVFSQYDVDRFNQLRQIDGQCFLLLSLGAAFVGDNIPLFKFKAAVYFDIACLNPGFFFQLSQSALLFLFSGINVTFGKIPAVCMSHQQKTTFCFPSLVSIILKDQESARIYFFHTELFPAQVVATSLKLIMKIYTKTGDEGQTGLLGGLKVSKTHTAIEAIGTVDELNSLLGLVVTHPFSSNPSTNQFGEPLKKSLTGIQNDLFDIGSRLAACLSDTDRVADLSEAKITAIENLIDHYEQTLPPLEAFILPSGCPAACHLHLARSVCRRAERRVVEMIESQKDLRRAFATELVYLNRLSDLLFVLSRAVNQDAGITEQKWQVTKLG